MKKILINSFFFLLLSWMLLGVSSCAQRTYNAVNYGKDIPNALQEMRDYLLRPGDKLSIQSFNNLSTVMYESTINNAPGGGGLPEFAVWVDNEGYIMLPRAGKVKVAGLTQKQATVVVNSAYAGVINNPGFSVQVKNMRVKILGAVNTQGLYYLERENQTLAEVLALAGGVKYENMGKKLVIIRQHADSSETMAFDLNAAVLGNAKLNNIVMRDNDIVYVQPSRASVNSAKLGQYLAFFAPISIIINTTALVIALSSNK